MKLLDRVRSILEQGGYSSTTVGLPAGQVAFEDENVYGFVVGLSTTQEIVTGWEELQDGFVKRHSASLNAVPAKAWNLYAVFLTEDDCTEEQARALVAVEEDFRGARKIAKAKVRSHNLEHALAPLLPVRFGGGETLISPTARMHRNPAISTALADALEEGADTDRLRALLLEGE